MPSLLVRLRFAVTDAASLRAWTVSANDGIIATAGVLEGFAGAGASEATLLTAAVVATVAGGLSLGGAKWSEESSEREAQLKLAAEEAAQLELSPAAEVAELTEYYVERGLTRQLAAEVADQLSAQDALAAQMETEHGIREIMAASAPVWAGATAAVAFMLGAVIPLLITVLVPGALEAWAIFFAVIVSLTITSIVAARRGHNAVWRTIVRTVGVGVGTLGASYLIGLLLF
jgi:vacuolar iron transporter family protein